MAKKIGPYVGVTGFMSRNEVTTALSFVPKESTRRLMVGVLMIPFSLRSGLALRAGSALTHSTSSIKSFRIFGI